MGWDDCVFKCGHNATFRMPGNNEVGICGCCLLMLKTLLFDMSDADVIEASHHGLPNCSEVIERVEE